MNQADWKKYLIVFVITVAIFVTGIYLSNLISGEKLNQIRDMQDKLSLDILASETRFLLLKESSCSDFYKNSILSDELDSLGGRVAFMENQLGTDNENVQQLKKYYSILEIKDYLLTKEVSKRCGSPSILVLYFYSNKDNCPDCKKQDYVLSYLKEQYPTMRIYYFDSDLELSAISTLLSVYKIKQEFPAIVIKEKVYNGFQSVEDILKILPELPPVPTSTATSTEGR